jgi:hypothetical protein
MLETQMATGVPVVSCSDTGSSFAGGRLHTTTAAYLRRVRMDRSAELGAIASFIATHGVSRWPARFSLLPLTVLCRRTVRHRCSRARPGYGLNKGQNSLVQAQ